MIQTRPRAPSTGLSYNIEEMIINTLTKLKSAGLGESTRYHVLYTLRKIAQNADLLKPEEVKGYVANRKVSNSYKNNLLKAYNYFALMNSIQWNRPFFRYERKIPMIPSTESVNKIIAAASNKYAVIFRILAETGVEAHELATTSRKDIDAERGLINVQGCKMHNSRQLKLKLETADLLRQYLNKHAGEHPFPASQYMSEIWLRTRNELAKKLNEPDLARIPMRNLRHYYATSTYAKHPDILLIMNRLGHKKIETTLLYTQLVDFEEDEEYTVRTASNIKEATDLLEHGFTYVQEIDGIRIYRKRK